MSEPVYFYTKNDPYFEFSNFAPFGFEIEGVYWPTVEHYLQAAKFHDESYRERIRRSDTPKEARALGQTRDVPIRDEWASIRVETMLKALRFKFRRPELRELLLSTGDRELIESSPFDHFLGCRPRWLWLEHARSAIDAGALRVAAAMTPNPPFNRSANGVAVGTRRASRAGARLMASRWALCRFSTWL